MIMHKPGQIFIVSAASGTGKTTLVSRLVANHSNIRVCVSHTSRAPRGAEQNGVHYHFISAGEFERLIGEGAFLEHGIWRMCFFGPENWKMCFFDFEKCLI